MVIPVSMFRRRQRRVEWDCLLWQNYCKEMPARRKSNWNRVSEPRCGSVSILIKETPLIIGWHLTMAGDSREKISRSRCIDTRGHGTSVLHAIANFTMDTIGSTERLLYTFSLFFSRLRARKVKYHKKRGCNVQHVTNTKWIITVNARIWYSNVISNLVISMIARRICYRFSITEILIDNWLINSYSYNFSSNWIWSIPVYIPLKICNSTV